MRAEVLPKPWDLSVFRWNLSSSFTLPPFGASSIIDGVLRGTAVASAWLSQAGQDGEEEGGAAMAPAGWWPTLPSPHPSSSSHA